MNALSRLPWDLTAPGLKTQSMIGGNANSVSNVENPIANVFVNASGLNIRASLSPRKNTGRNDARMISSENSRGRATPEIELRMIRRRCSPVASGCEASSAVQFSTITMVASTISPIAMKRPASENKLIVWLNPDIGIAVNNTPSSRMETGAIAVRTFRRNSTVTTMTTPSSYSSVMKKCCSVAQINCERSYAGTISTPVGKDAPISAIRFFRARVISSAFWVCSMITMPPTTSPSPFRSAMPRRWS